MYNMILIIENFLEQIDNPLSYLLVLVMTRAAALRTRWSLSVTERDEPMSRRQQ